WTCWPSTASSTCWATTTRPTTAPWSASRCVCAGACSEPGDDDRALDGRARGAGAALPGARTRGGLVLSPQAPPPGASGPPEPTGGDRQPLSRRSPDAADAGAHGHLHRPRRDDDRDRIAASPLALPLLHARGLRGHGALPARLPPEPPVPAGTPQPRARPAAAAAVLRLLRPRPRTAGGGAAAARRGGARGLRGRREHGHPRAAAAPGPRPQR